MLNKTLSIRCNSIKCDVFLDSFEYNIVLKSITKQRIHYPKVTLYEQPNNISQFLYIDRMLSGF